MTAGMDEQSANRREPKATPRRRGGSRPKRPVIREDGERFESVGAASVSAYGALGFESNIKRAIRTGGKAGGYRWSYENEEQR